jgi:hypothetical protein
MECPHERVTAQWLGFKTAQNQPTTSQWATGVLQNAAPVLANLFRVPIKAYGADAIRLPSVAAARHRDHEARKRLGLQFIDWEAPSESA